MGNIKNLMKKHNVRPSKSLGQNFLADANIINKIMESADINKNDLVIEIGPGLGSMTTEICKRAGKVVAVEIDTKLIPILTSYLSPYENIEIINNDILKTDINKDIIEKYNSQCNDTDECEKYTVKIVSNLPYYITTPIIMKILEEGVNAELMIFMVQLEVAERMCADPGGKDYGALSVAVRYYAEPEKLFDVSPHCFIPQPGVYSSVVRLSIREKPLVAADRKIFFKTVKAAFSQRRKTLLNALSNSGVFNKSKEDIRKILISMGLSENVRGEELSIEQFSELTVLLQR
jgi:16S rRNA (adenine1518-N6/adenine1519-N6)-dimethyltransferase